MNEYSFIVKAKLGNYKCKDFLKNIGISREILLKIKKGGIYLNDNLIQNVNDFVNSGDIVKIVLPPDKPNDFIKPVKGELKVLYEDEYMLAVYKPSGMPTHNSKGNKAISLDQLVCGYFLPNDFVFRAVNRLDRDTSGIVLIAKDMFSASLLGEMVKKGQIKKTYRAIVKGVPKEMHFIIEKPIRRLSSDGMKRVCASDGKHAKTECKLIKELDNGLSILEIILHTGRTHQIRVHLADVGLPLYADSLYGEKVEGKTYDLSASKLEFIHPFTYQDMIMEI